MFNISRKKTHEEFMAELAAVNPNIEVLTRYEYALSKVKCRCKIDGYEWEAAPAHLIRGAGCKVCGYQTVSEKLHTPFDEAVIKISKYRPDCECLYEFFDEVGNGGRGEWKLRIRCKTCGHEWGARLARILRGDRCARCSGMERKSTAQFRDELSLISPTIDIIGEYASRHSKVACRCIKCEWEWSATPGNLLGGWGCPHCRLSRGEKKISNFLDSKYIKYEQQHSFHDCRYVHVLLFDFYLPDYNTAIEYDGEQHYRPVKFGGKNDEKSDERFELTKIKDGIKTRYCEDKGIKLIRIPYTEFDNIEDILSKQLL